MSEHISLTDPTIRTNTIEGQFSAFKRGIKGNHQNRSKRDRTATWPNLAFVITSGFDAVSDDAQPAEAAIRGIMGNRLTYKEPITRQSPHKSTREGFPCECFCAKKIMPLAGFEPANPARTPASKAGAVTDSATGAKLERSISRPLHCESLLAYAAANYVGCTLRSQVVVRSFNYGASSDGSSFVVVGTADCSVEELSAVSA